MGGAGGRGSGWRGGGRGGGGEGGGGVAWWLEVGVVGGWRDVLRGPHAKTSAPRYEVYSIVSGHNKKYLFITTSHNTKTRVFDRKR